MFQKIRYRLLLSYLVVFASLLAVFAIAVRVAFNRSLTQQLIDKLTALGQGAAANAEFEDGHIKIEEGFRVQNLIDRQQALQWFDTDGRLISQQGQPVLTLPFSVSERVQVQTGKIRIQGVILPIIGENDGKLIGYVRASQSLKEFDETLSKLDLGLGSGIAIALLFSGIGGVVLTRQAMQPIEESFQRLKQFTADASHELRNPLMAIKTNVAVALKYPEGMRDTDAEKFSAIASATNQMTCLTEDLLLLARTDKVASMDWDTVNLELILEDLVQLYKPQYEAKQINFKAKFIQPLYLMGDAVHLTRLFTNLIQNALYYTLSEGTVEITASRVDSHLVVKIQDTGVGIASEHLEQVFERFWRTDKSRSYWDGGLGLGLAIAQAIAKNHGGLITVTSQLGVGSCFTVRLPASLPH
ncbi:MAG TPA: HAMP domain-containing sensor histidine kinase [Oculatellaceae cyanobacterium]